MTIYYKYYFIIILFRIKKLNPKMSVLLFVTILKIIKIRFYLFYFNILSSSINTCVLFEINFLQNFFIFPTIYYASHTSWEMKYST